MPTLPGRFTHTIPDGLTPSRHAVHVAMLAPDDALALVIARADGLLGLPGGFVDPGETLRAAAARELHEELGDAASALAPALTHLGVDREWLARTGLASHLFCCAATAEQLRAIARGIVDAPHFLHEIMGALLVHTDLRRFPAAAQLPRRASLENFSRHNFVANSRAQLEHALLHAGMIDAPLNSTSPGA